MTANPKYRTEWIRFADCETLDAFGRVRVSTPFSLMDTTLQYDTSPLWWETSTSGNASAVHLPNKASVQMIVGSDLGDRVVRQSRQYARYQPGKSQAISLTGTMGAHVTNVRKRIGYFDDRNGVFFEQSSGSMFVVKRSFISGSAVDVRVPQSQWNLDKLDGTKGVTLDITKNQIWSIDLTWLGSGRVRYAIWETGTRVHVHENLYSNVDEDVYMTTANLPLRYEIDNIGATSGSNSMTQICGTVMSEGGVEERGVVLATSNGSAKVVVSTTFRPILSIRVSSCMPSGGSIPNRISVIPLSYRIFSEDDNIHYKIMHNPSLSGANFAPVNSSYSGVDVDTSASVIVSQGTVIDAGYISAAKDAAAEAHSEIATNIFMVQNTAGTQGDILTIGAVRIGAANSDCYAVITWKELY